MKNLFSLSCLLSLLWACSSPEMKQEANTIPPNIATDSLHLELQQLADTGLYPGFALSIFTKDSLLFQNAYGYANVENQEPYTLQTTQIIASISKTFVGVGLMKAVEDGQIDLDADINDYLPFEVKNPYFPNEKITLRHLATHTSGLKDPDIYRKSYVFSEPLVQEDFPEAWHPLLEGYDGNSFLDLGDFLQKIIAKNGEWHEDSLFLEHPPGTYYEYSNLGAALAAFVLERAIGQDFRTYTQKHILEKLNMKNSTWFLEKVSPKLHATDYLENHKRVPHYKIVTYPDGGLYSNVEDMTAYLQAVMRGYYDQEANMLQATSFKELTRQQFEGDTLTQALFWDLDFPCCIGHGSNDFGTATLMFFSKKRGVGAVFFTNISTETDELYGTMMEIFGKALAY